MLPNIDTILPATKLLYMTTYHWLKTSSVKPWIMVAIGLLAEGALGQWPGVPPADPGCSNPSHCQSHLPVIAAAGSSVKTHKPPLVVGCCPAKCPCTVAHTNDGHEPSCCRSHSRLSAAAERRRDRQDVPVSAASHRWSAGTVRGYM